MTMRILLIAVGIAWVAALVGLIWMMTLAGMRFHHTPFLLTDMGLGPKGCLALSIVSLAIGINRLYGGERRHAVIGIAGAFVWGVLGAVYGATNAQNMLIHMNPPIPFAIYATSYAEAITVLLVGLTGTFLGLVLLSLGRPR